MREGVTMGYTLSADVEHKVLQDVLKSYLKEEDLNSAIHLWDQQYHGQPLEKLSFFVFEIATTSTLRMLRKDILKELELQLKNSTQPEGQIQVTRYKMFDRSSSSTTQPVENTQMGTLLKSNKTMLISTEEIDGQVIIKPEVLTEFVNLLKVGIAHINAYELTQILNEYLEEKGLPNAVCQEINDVLLRGGKLQVVTHEAEHIRKLINIVYGILCEYQGPVKTDRLLTKTIICMEQKYPLENLRQFL